MSGQNAVTISVQATKDQNMVPIAETVKQYMASRNESFLGIKLESIVDMTYYLNARLDMMLKNLYSRQFW